MQSIIWSFKPVHLLTTLQWKSQSYNDGSGISHGWNGAKASWTGYKNEQDLKMFDSVLVPTTSQWSSRRHWSWKKVIKFKEQQYKRKVNKASLSQNNWREFKGRYTHSLIFQREQHFTLNHPAVQNFSNMNKIYEDIYIYIYTAMTKCKVE